MANTQDYFDSVKITAVESFILLAQGQYHNHFTGVKYGFYTECRCAWRRHIVLHVNTHAVSVVTYLVKAIRYSRKMFIT